jgi:hypothetical protein
MSGEKFIDTKLEKVDGGKPAARKENGRAN